MLGLWLTTIGAVSILFATLYFFYLSIRNSVNPEDAYTIDKLPDGDGSN